MAIGENIRKARERKGLRQEQVAEMAGHSPVYIQEL
ncbi:helix-turn-helix domain-containing protein [Pseudomonas aeruginosa]|nr:helix-turn-helix domain-containing protein [Pseudomonas aeruginosa]